MNFEVIDTSYHVSLEVHDYMINGVVDLIIRDGEGVSLVHFIQSRDKIRNYHHFYMDLLGYYAMALTQVEDVKVENLILYVLDEAKIYEQEYREDAFLIKYLEGVIQNIDGDDYTKHRVNCKDCEFNDYLCTGH